VDNGLRRIQGRKTPSVTLDVDLQPIARAVTSAMRRQAVAQVIRTSGLSFVQINGRGINVTVPQRDWVKLLRLIQDESLTTQVVPVASAVRELDTVVVLSPSTVDARDPLYQRVHGVLSRLFTSKVPT
jgi:hypothetical protein